MVFMLHEAQGKLRKLALPYHGLYCVLDLTSTGATLRPVDQPTHEPILVNLDRITKCSSELPDISWLGPRSRRQRRRRLRSRQLTVRESLPSGVDQKETYATRGCVKQRRREL